MDALSDAKYVAAVHGIPQRGAVAEVGLGRKEELQGDVRRSWRVCQEAMGLVVRGEITAERTSCFS